jgi:Tol biopolymer transport system component
MGPTRGAVVLAMCAVLAGSAPSAEAAVVDGRLAFAEETIDAPVPPRVMTVDPRDGATPSVLDVLPWTEPAPSWSADGTRIVFSRALDRGFLPDLWTVDADLGQLTQLTDTPAIAEQEPAWSPDGSKVAYVEPGAAWPAGRIFVLDLTTGVSTALSPPDGLDDQPSWSPDGTKIAFARGAYGSRDVYVMDAATGTDATALTSAARDDNAPDWSPDGRSIAWAGGDDGSLGAEIWVAQANGRGAHALTHNRVPDLHPSWSPDGQRIAFQRTDVDAALWPDGIWTMSRTGRQQQLVTPLGRQPDWGAATAVGG